MLDSAERRHAEESRITEELYCDTDSKEQPDGSHISSEDSQESDKDELEWRGEVPTDKAYAHQSVGEHTGLNKTTFLQSLTVLSLYTGLVWEH
jgi:hypothetical protein